MHVSQLMPIEQLGRKDIQHGDVFPEVCLSVNTLMPEWV